MEFLIRGDGEVTACVATEYGEMLLEPAPNLTISAQRLDAAEMKALFEREKFELVVDATHPYAAEVTENLVQACRETKTEYLRLLREKSAVTEDAVFVPDVAGAVEYLNKTEGNILLTTGSKELAAFTELNGYAERIYARVLPLATSLQLCQAAGLLPSHILAMQGPFSEEMNMAMLHAVNARYMVTKDTGRTGGFEEKIAAAGKAGTIPIVIGRPPQQEGVSLAEAFRLLGERFGIPRTALVAVVGIGPGSRETMTAEALAAIAQAECIIGAGRMLEAALDAAAGGSAVAGGALPVRSIAVSGRAQLVEAIAPEKIAAAVREHAECRSFAVVMSGDVGFYSGTKKLLPLLSDCEVRLIPGISSLSMLCSRLGTSYEDVKLVSLHGREHNIVRELRENRRVFALVGGGNGAADLCRTCVAAGLGSVRVSVGERLSYPDEQITCGTAEELCGRKFASLSAVLLENPGASAVVIHGLADDLFQRGSSGDAVIPMTKSEVRSVCLSKLQLTKDAVCWDIGAGTGSVAVEMALQASAGHVWAVERKEAAVELLRENAIRLGAENVTAVAGTAPEACWELPAPTHVFIGGSSGNMREILSVICEKNPGVRIVATAISLESVGELSACLREFPFSQTEVVSVTVARDKKVGNYHLMTGQNPVYIFTMQAGKEEV